ncbi:hypothetical protein V7x_28830 [Crateriforma conspicua]|uniref:Uncharacterized protein n=1 Tax=Crateriforma conspicua TaxID=2527996 RepID=A0A5C6FWP9_9PLAN|nr:hypothetical protein [Crateriforma conspicua]TWU67309.1 hypothetical protein V7x_28830 [Crateriforma conspicua]
MSESPFKIELQPHMAQRERFGVVVDEPLGQFRVLVNGRLAGYVHDAPGSAFVAVLPPSQFNDDILGQIKDAITAHFAAEPSPARLPPEADDATDGIDADDLTGDFVEVVVDSDDVSDIDPADEGKGD